MSNNTLFTADSFVINLTAIIGLLAITSGCSLFYPRQNYYGRPTLTDRGLNKNIIINGEEILNEIKTRGIDLTDVDVFTFMNDVKQAWRERSQTARVSGLAGGFTSVGLAAAATTTAATHGGTLAGNTVPILTGIGTFIQSLFGLFDPAGRDVAYEDGIAILLRAQHEYCETLIQQTGQCHVDGNKMSQAGVTLLDRTNAAIAAVDKALAGRIPTKEQLEHVTVKTNEEIKQAIIESATLVAVNTTSLVLAPASSQTVTILRGKELVVSSENDRVATVKETLGSNGQKYDITADPGGDCKSTNITFSTPSKALLETKSVAVRVESVQDFKITAPSGIKAYKNNTSQHPLAIAGCALKTVKSTDTNVAVVKLFDGHTISVEGKTTGNTTVELTNMFDRTTIIPVTVFLPPVPYSKQPSKDMETVKNVKELQAWLNSYHVSKNFKVLIVDGTPGDNTSDAYKLVTGQRLPGDTRP